MRLPTFRTRAADRAHAVFMPDAAWPVGGLPPGSSPNTAESPGFRRLLTTFRHFDNGRLRGPHLTPPGRLFRIAHHDGLQPTQHAVVWSLPPQGDAEGPSLISRTAPHQGARSPTSRASSLRSWHTGSCSSDVGAGRRLGGPVAGMGTATVIMNVCDDVSGPGGRGGHDSRGRLSQVVPGSDGRDRGLFRTA